MRSAYRFRDRLDAGRRLGEELETRGFAGRSDVLVLALPRGGVPVAFEVARALRAPLDVFLVRKIGVPGQEELAMGAIASGGVRIINRDVVGMLGISERVFEQVARMQQAELERRERQYRVSRGAPEVGGRTVIVIDDGLATGSSMRAAVAALRQQKPGQPARIVVAVPVAAEETCELLRSEVDDLVCLMMPAGFQAVGQWYDDFEQTSDEEVRDLLSRATREPTDMPNHTEATRE